MKANEAPEKIYIEVTSDGTRYYRDVVKEERTENTDIEYVRSDAFIEKASEYFHRSLEDTKVIDDYRNILVRGIQASYTSVEEFIEGFKNYMKEE